MRVESQLELLAPSVQYGSIRLISKIGLDSITDLARVEESQQKFGIKGDKHSTDVILEITRKLALEELMAMKKQVDSLAAQTFTLDQFSGSKR